MTKGSNRFPRMMDPTIGMLGLLAGQAFATAVLSIPFRSQLLAGSSEPASLSSAYPLYYIPGVRVHPNYSFSVGFLPHTFRSNSSAVRTLACALSTANIALPSWIRFDPETVTVSGTSPSVPTALNITITCAEGSSSTAASDWFILEVGRKILEISRLPKPLEVMVGNIATLSLSTIQQTVAVNGARATASDGLIVTLDNRDAPWLQANGSIDVYQGLVPADLADTNTAFSVAITVQDRFQDVFTFSHPLAVRPAYFTNSILPPIIVTPPDAFSVDLRNHMHLPTNSSLKVTLGVVETVDNTTVWMHFDSDNLILSGIVPFAIYTLDKMSPKSEEFVIRSPQVTLAFTAIDQDVGFTSATLQELFFNPVPGPAPSVVFQTYEKFSFAIIGVSSIVFALGLCLLLLWAWSHAKERSLPNEPHQDFSRRVYGRTRTKRTSRTTFASNNKGEKTLSKPALDGIVARNPRDMIGPARVVEPHDGSISHRSVCEMPRPPSTTTKEQHSGEAKGSMHPEGPYPSIRLVHCNSDAELPFSRDTTFSGRASRQYFQVAPYSKDSLDARNVLTGQNSSLYRLFEKGDNSVISPCSFLPQSQQIENIIVENDDDDNHLNECHSSILPSPPSEYSGLRREIRPDDPSAPDWLHSHPATEQAVSSWSLAFTGSPELGHRPISWSSNVAMNPLGSNIPIDFDSVPSLSPFPSPDPRYNFDLKISSTPAGFYSSDENLSAGSRGSPNKSALHSPEGVPNSNQDPVGRLASNSPAVMDLKIVEEGQGLSIGPKHTAVHLSPVTAQSTALFADDRHCYLSSPESQQSQEQDVSRMFTLQPRWDWSLHQGETSNMPPHEVTSEPQGSPSVITPPGLSVKQSSLNQLDRPMASIRDRNVRIEDLSATWEF
ncbi:hypothetical protein FRB94_008982 [Tulasnella sp. JGI-2019a]|nr:hypothetical protein FRB93_003488 [Tulasnella sp. JGI-2019a]KAG9014824.1 hypothetical protein FRB94_008982 [Tulasnella sp. JGI-2019a]KAG9040015.1 hypothetical protein FRB95_004487 [Tulasnella sp. JGI-2019a]